MSFSTFASAPGLASLVALGFWGVVACGGSDETNRGAVDDARDASDTSAYIDPGFRDAWSPLDGAARADAASDGTSIPADDTLGPVDTQAPDALTPDTSPAACALPWGASLAHGESATAYPDASVGCGEVCSAEARVCDDGVLSGAASSQTCFVAACQPCALPWGGSVAHGGSVTAYASGNLGCGGQCVSEARTCDDGELSGSYPAQACSVSPCGTCALPWGGSIAHGGSVSAYASGNVGCGGQCVSEVRTCTDGVLSGGHTAQACTVAACGTCALPWGGSLAHGASVTAYAAASPACGGACASEVRSCSDGVLSGANTAPACTVAPCNACALPWGGTLAHGASVTAYAAAAPACGGACASQVRSCNSGALSGSYTAQSCSVSPCAPEFIFSTSWGGPAMTSIAANRVIYGRLLNLTATNAQSCAEPIGTPVPNCRNGAPWTTFPNNDWLYDSASSEWRTIIPANTFSPVTVELFARNMQTGQQTSMVLVLSNPCSWSAIVAGPVAPPTSPACVPTSAGTTTDYSGYTWTCTCG